MGEQAESAAGYHVIWGTGYIGECPELKIPDKTRNMIENSTHDALAANGGQETQSPGTITLGKGSVKIYYIGSTVHDSLETDFDAKTERTIYFIRPSNGALAGTCRKGTAIISKMAEPVDKKGLITWEAEVTMTSGLTTIKTPAGGLTTPFFVVSDDDTPTPNVITPVPAAAAAVYDNGGGSAADSGGICTVTGGSSWQQYRGQVGFGTGYIVESLAKVDTDDAGWSFGWDALGDGSSARGIFSTDSSGTKQYVSWNSTQQSTSRSSTLTNYIILGIIRNGSTSLIFQEGRSTVATHSSQVPTSTIYPYIARKTAGKYLRLDWVLVRKYLATEPTLAIVWKGANPTWGHSVRAYLASQAATGVEHVFPTVNVNHNMVAGVGAQEIELGPVNVTHGMIPGIGIVEVEMGPVNIYHPMYPSATMQEILEPVTGMDDSLVSVTVHQGTDDFMAQADFEYDGMEVGNYFSGDYMKRVVVKMPDYLGTVHTAFAGICPSSNGHNEPAKDKIVMRAFDYGLYLTSNPLEINDLSLLPPVNQNAEGSNVAKILHYRNATKPFQKGMYVIGTTSSASGTVVELVQGDEFRRMTLYPAQGKFIDGEDLEVGGVVFALADGRSVDTSYTPFYSIRTPADWFKSILGGDNWMNVTGIRPKKIVPCGWDADSTPPAVPMIFSSDGSRADAAKKFAEYLGYIVLVKLGDWGGGLYGPDFYAVPLSSIDDETDGLDLPTPLTVTSPDDFLDGKIDIVQNGEAQCDRVVVRCRNLKGKWMEAIRSNSRVDNAEGPYRTLTFKPENIATSDEMNDYADLMYDIHVARACTWTAIFYDRPDLEYLQRIIFSGYGLKIPNGTYRVTHISKEYGCAKNQTTVQLMLATDYDNRMKASRTPSDSIKEVERIAKALIDKNVPAMELATCTANDGYTVTYETDSGKTGQCLDSTSTPDSIGVIGIGERIAVHGHSSGGSVGVPIVGSSGSSSDLLVVDVPTIVNAAVDPADHNYWNLAWVPGSNNSNVSVNFQPTTYPTAPGSPAGTGTFTKKISIATKQLRIRFSGPSTTYYIKLWGEKNGHFSTTGATATITSGADVTPPDTPEEPEPIGILDQAVNAGIPAAPSASNASETNPTIIDMGGCTFNWTDVFTPIYIGGPYELKDPNHTVWIPSWYGEAGYWYPREDRPSPRMMLINNMLRITCTETGQHIDVGSYSPATGGWKYPVQINSILGLTAGVKHLTFTFYDAGSSIVCSELWLRTYYL